MTEFSLLRTLAGVLLTAAVTFSTDAEGVLPIEAYTSPERLEPGSFRISPSGKYISAIAPLDDRSVLLIYDHVSNKPTAKLQVNAGQYIYRYWWVSDSRVVITLAVKEGKLDTPSPTGEMWAIDADGQNGKQIFRENEQFASAFMLEPEADANNNILVALQPWSYTGEVPFLDMARLNINTGRFKKDGGKIPIRYFNDVLTDTNKIARVIHGTNAKNYGQLYYRAPGGESWVLLNDEEKTSRDVYPLSYSRDGKSFYARVSDHKNPDYLIRFNLGTLTESVIYKPEQANIGSLLLTADGNDAYAVIDYDSDPRGGLAIFKRDAPEAQLSKDLGTLFPDALAIANSFSRDGRYATVVVTSDRNPGKLYVYDRDQKKIRMTGSIRPDLNSEHTFRMEPMEFKARDGLTVRGWVTLPSGGASKHPMVVMPHGGPYGVVDRWGFDPDAQLLASRGYAVLQINYRGSGGYGQAFIDAGHHEWGGKMQLDITDGTLAAISEFPIDPNRVCIFGASYGAYAALMAVATEPALFKCAAGYSGIYDLNLEYNQSSRSNMSAVRNYFKDIFVNDKEWLASRSPTTMAGKIKAPVLLIHGGKDTNTPPKQAELMRKSLIASGNAPEWVYEETEGHGFFNPTKRLNAYRKLVEFLDRHIGPQAK